MYKSRAARSAGYKPGRPDSRSVRYSFREPGERVGAVSSTEALLYRDLDTGFSTKWTGLWVPPTKYLDFHAYRVNGVWLSPENCSGAEYGSAMVHHFELESLKVSERLEAPQEFAGVRSVLRVANTSDTPKAVKTGLELGVDIRPKSRDLGPGSYTIEKGETVKVRKDERHLEVAPDESFEVNGSREVRNHRPGGERQRCVVPGELGFRWELEPEEEFRLETEFRTDRESSGLELSEFENMYSGELSHEFTESVNSMRNLVYGRNFANVVAGHPWFQSYWARDSLWTALGLIDAGEFEICRRMLEGLAERGLPAKVSLEGGTESGTREDHFPLFVLAADKLERHYGTTERIEEAKEEAMHNLELEKNMVQHDPEGTWMDTLKRSPAVELQSLWLEACSKVKHDRAAELEKGLEKFLNDDFASDYTGEQAPRTVNVAVPLMFGHLEEEANKLLERLNGEFSSLYGARTRSVADPGYESSGYHTGSVWGLTTGWAAAANLRHGNEKQGMNFLRRLARTSEGGQPGGFPEVLDAETGESLGCTEQAWSAGLMAHVTDRYLLGIRAESPESLEVNPCSNVTGKRTKRTRDGEVSLKFREGELVNVEGEVEVKCL